MATHGHVAKPKPKKSSLSDQGNTDLLAAQLDPLRELIETPSLTELMVNSDGSVWIERAGRLTVTKVSLSGSHRYSIIRELAGFNDLVCNRDSPTLACRLPVLAAGRVQAVVPPITDGPMITIRFPARTKLSLKALVKLGTLDRSMADRLTELVKSRQNLIIAGGTGSGKTTLANALLDLLDNERILIIEDTPELVLLNANTVYWQTSTNFSARDAVKTALRVRPDRIILGELRGAESLEWAKASLTGHPGSLATLHSSSAEGVRQRMCALMQEGVSSRDDTLFDLIDSAIDAVVFVSRKIDPASNKIVRRVETLIASKTIPFQNPKEVPA